MVEYMWRKGIKMRILYAKEAVKYIKTQDKNTKTRLKEAIEKLPLGDVKKLQGLEKVASIELPTTQVSISEEKLQLVQEYKEDLKKLKDFLTEGKRLKELIDARTKDIDKCKEVLKEVDVCPLCGQEMKDCKELVKC